MNTRPTLYFARGSAEHTQYTLQAAKERAVSLKPEAVVMASSRGQTGLEAAHIFKGTGFRIIAVPFQKHLWGKYTNLDPKMTAECRQLGVEFLPDEPAIPMIGEEHPDIANAWRCVSQGFKVALQVASMCVDTGLLEDGAFVIALGGTERGADTAVAVQTRGYADILKSNVTEIIAMPSE